ncbi:alcohol dehydrogenase [Tylopilus felleus]
MTALTLQSKLNDGNEIPVLGFGAQMRSQGVRFLRHEHRYLPNDEAYKMVRWALEAGYRHIGSADWYHNEEDCGRAIHEFIHDNGLQRSDVKFYTSKLKSNSGKANASWEAIPIGINNFGVRHMQELLGKGFPDSAVNQVDLHPFMTRTDIFEYCTPRTILLEAWTPLVEDHAVRPLRQRRLVKKYDKEPAEILLRYALQRVSWLGFIPLPKSSHKPRITSNMYDFELEKEGVEYLDPLLDQGCPLVTDWDPTDCP